MNAIYFLFLRFRFLLNDYKSCQVSYFLEGTLQQAGKVADQKLVYEKEN